MLEWKIEIIGYKDETISEDKWSRHYERLYKTCEKDNPDVTLKGGQYKKLYETWDICDYGWVTTWEEYWESCQRWHQEAINRGWGHYKDDLDEEKEYRHWYKHYKGK